MVEVDLLQEYKELYYKEIEMSDRLSNKINTCITFLTILGSGQILIWIQLLDFQKYTYTVICMVACTLSTCLFITSLYKFYKAYSGYKMGYFPIKDMAIAISKTIDMAGERGEDANKHIYNMMCERFINDAIHNRMINIEKNKRHKTLSYFICITFMITILTYSLNIGISFYESEKRQETIQNIYIQGGEINVK